LKALDVEIVRSHSQQTNLSLCLMQLDIEGDPAQPAADRVIRSLGQSFAQEIRGWDTLGRYGAKTIALLLPQVAIEGARRLCDRLVRISEKSRLETGGRPVNLAFGLAELTFDKEETGADLIDRAAALLESPSQS